MQKNNDYDGRVLCDKCFVLIKYTLTVYFDQYINAIKVSIQSLSRPNLIPRVSESRCFTKYNTFTPIFMC